MPAARKPTRQAAGGFIHVRFICGLNPKLNYFLAPPIVQAG